MGANGGYIAIWGLVVAVWGLAKAVWGLMGATGGYIVTRCGCRRVNGGYKRVF